MIDLTPFVKYIRILNDTYPPNPSYQRRLESSQNQESTRFARHWIPAYAGMTSLSFVDNDGLLELRDFSISTPLNR